MSKQNAFGWVAMLLTVLAASFALPFAANEANAQEAQPVGDVANGMVIYQQRCANCHGPIGLGDGELAANLPNSVPALGSDVYGQAAIPSAMFEIITNGNVQNGMPLFGEGSSNPLSEQERWDVIAAAFALGTSGEALLDSAETVTDAQRETLAAVDWANMNNALVAQQLATDGLDADAAQALAAWGRMTYSAEYFLGTATITGVVQNATLNQPQSDVLVELVAFEEFERADVFSAEVDETGRYEIVIDNVPADWFSRLGTTFDGIDYSSPFLRFTQNELAFETDLTVYNTTDNDGGIRLQLLNTVVEASRDALVFNQLYAFENINNQVYVGGVSYGVPDSAENLSVSHVEADQFFPIALDANQLDTTPIYPGQNTLTAFLRYSIPFDSEATVTHVVNYDLQRAALSLPAGMDLQEDGAWAYRETDSANGLEFDNYDGTLDGTFTVSISGAPEFATDASTGARILIRDETRELLIGGSALAVVLAGAFVMLRSWQQQAVTDPTALLQEIAALDDAFAAKQIKRQLYEERRKELIQRVRDSWDVK